MNRDQLMDVLDNLNSEGGLEALLPQNLPSDFLNELCEVSKDIAGDLYGDMADVFRSYAYKFLFGKGWILPSVWDKKIQLLSLALSAEKLRRKGNVRMKPWQLPNVENLFDDKNVDYYFYNDNLDIPKTSHSSNPLRIIDDPHLNKTHRLPNLVNTFEKDVMAYFNVFENNRGGITEDEFIKVIVYYIIDLLIEYRDKAGNILPLSIIEDTKNQVLIALKNHFEIFNQQPVVNKLFTQIDNKIYEEHIVPEAQNYLRRIRQR